MGKLIKQLTKHESEGHLLRVARVMCIFAVVNVNILVANGVHTCLDSPNRISFLLLSSFVPRAHFTIIEK